MKNESRISVRTLTAMALLIAMSIVFSRVLSISTGFVRFNLGSLPVLLAGILFGPWAGFVVGMVADIIGGVLAGYAINPLITLGAASIGLVGGLGWQKLSHLRTGNEAAAKSGGLAAMKKAKANGADKPQAVILTGAQGDETHEARLRGYRNAVEQAGGTVLEVQYCDAQPDRAAAAMEAVMQKYPQGVDALLVTSDDMALAAIKCIWDNNSAAYRKTVICGFDGNHAAVEALDRGELTVDIAQQGYEMGYKAVEAALDALEGKSVESVIDSGSEVTTADNIDAYIADCREKGLWS